MNNGNYSIQRGAVSTSLSLSPTHNPHGCYGTRRLSFLRSPSLLIIIILAISSSSASIWVLLLACASSPQAYSQVHLPQWPCASLYRIPQNGIISLNEWKRVKFTFLATHVCIPFHTQGSRSSSSTCQADLSCCTVLLLQMRKKLVINVEIFLPRCFILRQFHNSIDFHENVLSTALGMVKMVGRGLVQRVKIKMMMMMPVPIGCVDSGVAAHLEFLQLWAEIVGGRS